MKLKSLLISLVVASAACAPLDSTGQVCRLMPELDSSTVAIAVAFEDLAEVDSAVLESSLSVLIDTLNSLLESPPSEIEEALLVLDRAYREVRVALLNVDFDGQIAVNDAATINALSGLRRSDVIRAFQRLDRFVAERCNADLESPIPPAMGDGTSLPTPIQTPDETEEYPFVVEDEPSALTAYGYLLVAGREIVMDDAQAECIGRSVSNAALESGSTDDSVLDTMIDRALSECTESPSTSTTSAGAGD